MLNNRPQMQLTLLQKRETQKTAQTAGDLIGNKTTNKITKVSRNTPENNSGTVESTQKIKDLIEEYQKKDIYLQKKDKVLLMI